MDPFHSTPDSKSSSSTIYMPISSPPTPAPSPSPHLALSVLQSLSSPAYNSEFTSLSEFASLPPPIRLRYLSQLLSRCNTKELAFVSATIAPLLKHDFLKELPVELAVYILQFIDSVQDLILNVGEVSRHWRLLSQDELIWRRMCFIWGFIDFDDLSSTTELFMFRQHFKMSYITSSCNSLFFRVLN